MAHISVLIYLYFNSTVVLISFWDQKWLFKVKNAILFMNEEKPKSETPLSAKRHAFLLYNINMSLRLRLLFIEINR